MFEHQHSGRAEWRRALSCGGIHLALLRTAKANYDSAPESSFAAMVRSLSAVKSSAGKKVSSAISDSVISIGVPKIMVVEIKLSTSPPSRILNGIATLSAMSGAERTGIG